MGATNKQLEYIFDRLYRKYNNRQDFPVEDEWEYRRIAYDLAVGARWSRQIDRPFIYNASATLKQRAFEIAEQMLDDPDNVIKFYEESISYRRYDPDPRYPQGDQTEPPPGGGQGEQKSKSIFEIIFGGS